MSLDLGTLVASIGLDISALTPAANTATQQLGQVQQAAAAVGGNLSVDKAIAGLARLGQEGRRAQDLLNGPAEQLQHLSQATGQSVDDLRADLQRMVTDAQQAGVQIGQVGEQAEESGSKLQQLATKVGGLFSAVSPALGDSIEGLGDKAKLAGAAMGAAVGIGLLGAVNAEPAKKKLVAQLALTPEEQQRISATAEGLFNTNYGDLDSINDAIKNVIQNVDGMRAASTEDLQSIAGQAISLGDTFDQDIGGVAVAVGQLMKTGLAANAQDALDILTAGFQAGNDKAGDLLDTVNEYGTQFRKAGIDGKTAMGLIQQGLQGGARDADLVADAIKEMSIRLQDGSALDGLNQLGLNGNAIIAQFREGGPQAAAALDTVIDKIRDTNAVTEDLAAVQLVAGTQVEDLGAAFNSLDISSASAQLGDIAGKSKEVDAAIGDTVAGSLNALKNQGISALTDLGGVVLPILSDVVGAAGFLVSGLSDLVGWFGQLPGPIKTVAVALGALALAKATGLISALATGLVRARSQMALMGATAGGTVGKLKSFGSAALGAVGGPGGLIIAGAITAVTVALGSMKDATERADQALAGQASSVQSLAAALKESNGVIDDSVRSAAAAALQGQQIGTQGKNLLDVGREMGLTVAQLVDAQLGQADAVKAVNAAMDEYLTQASRSGDEDRINGAVQYARALREQIGLYPAAIALAKEQAANEAAATAGVNAAADAEKNRGLLVDESMRSQAGSVERYVENYVAAKAANENFGAAVQAASEIVDGSVQSEQRRAVAIADSATQQSQANTEYENAQAAAEAAGEALSTFEQASKDSADAQSELADQAQRVSDELDRQSGRAISLEEANSRAAEAGDKLAETFKQGEEGALRLSDAIIQSDGSINTSTETARTFREGVLDTRDAMVDQATAAFDAAGGLGNLEGATKAAEAATQATYDQFIQTATAAGLTGDAAKNLAKEYGLLPSDVVTAVRADDQASQAIINAQIRAETFAQRKYEATITANQGNLDSQIALAKSKLSALGQVSTSVTGPNQYRAAGGAIFGPGTGTSDDVPIMASNGEHMLTADEVAKAGGQGAIYRLRQVIRSGGLPKYAAGGGIGVNVGALSGIESRNLGGNESLVVGALGDLMDAVRDLIDAEKDATDEAKEARSDWNSAIDDFRKTRNKGAANVADARADRGADVRDAQADVRKAAADGAEKVAAAEKKLTEARQLSTKTHEDRVKRDKAIAAATAARDKERQEATKANTAAENALSRARSQGNEAVRRASAEANKANDAAEKKVAAERKQYQAAERARKAAEARAAEAEADLRRTAKARQVLTALGRAADTATKNLQDSRAKLDDLKDSRQGLIQSIASTLKGFGGGILGNSEQRRTPEDVLRGLSFQAGKVEDFGADLAALKKKGLSAALLEQIAASGVDGGAATADALANATPAMLAKINAAAARTNTAAVAAGTTVGNAVYEKQIAAQLAQARQAARVLQEINTNQKNLAAEIGDQFGLIVGAVGADELAVLVEKGKSTLRRRGVKI